MLDISSKFIVRREGKNVIPRSENGGFIEISLIVDDDGSAVESNVIDMQCITSDHDARGCGGAPVYWFIDDDFRSLNEIIRSKNGIAYDNEDYYADENCFENSFRALPVYHQFL
jgi:hypothetical protein